MSQTIDMTNLIIKNWQVVERGQPSQKVKNTHTAWWKCKCIECGAIHNFNGVDLRRNKIGSHKCNTNKNISIPQNKPKLYGAIIDETNNRYGRLLVISFSHIYNSKAYWNCLCDCGNMITVCGNHLRTGRIKSCGCIVSWKEQEVSQILKELNVSFCKEYSFNDLQDKAKLRFDFAIFKNNQLIGLIEYNGSQHYSEPEKFNHYGILQKHDIMKIEYCNQNNIPLLILKAGDNLYNNILSWLQTIEYFTG